MLKKINNIKNIARIKIGNIKMTLKCKNILIICHKTSINMFYDYLKNEYEIEKCHCHKNCAYVKLKNGYEIDLISNFNEYQRWRRNTIVYIEYGSISIDFDKMYLIECTANAFCKKDAIRFIFYPNDINDKEIKSNLYNFIHCIDKNIFKI